MRGTARVWAFVALCLTACGGDEKSKPDTLADASEPDAGSADPCHGATALTAAELLSEGPHEVALLDLPLVDESRTTAANGNDPEKPSRSLPTKVWFPADGRGRLAAGGPFPLIVWGHGLSSTNDEVLWLAEHLARKGYVFAAPQHPLSNRFTDEPKRDLGNTPGDFSFVLDALLAKNAAADDALHGAIDADRIVAGGFSNGAATATITTFHPELRDARVKALVALVLAGAFYGPELLGSRDVPWLEVHGKLDAFQPYDPQATSLQQNAAAPFWQATILKGSHTGFSQVAQTLDQPDELGCSFDEHRGDPVPDYEAIGGTEAGFVIPPPATPDDGITCANTDPLPDTLTGKEQTDIARQVVTAFLAMHVGPEAGRDAACAFLADKVENPDSSFTLFAR